MCRRPKTLTGHVTSNEHLLAVSGSNSAQPTMIGMHNGWRDSEKHAYIAVFRSVYWLVTKEMHNRKHASRLNLQRLHGCRDVAALRRGCNSTKESHWSFVQRLQGCRDVAALRRGGNSTKESNWSFNQLLSALNGEGTAEVTLPGSGDGRIDGSIF